MPATPTLVVEQADGTERFQLDCVTAERTDSLIEMWTAVATDIGSGEFTATVDISGQLTPGSNTIEAQSDSLGLVNLLISTSLFRQGTP